MSQLIEPIKPGYDSEISHIIQTVGAEFGAIGEGFGPADDEVKAMSQHYGKNNRSQYNVALLNGKVVGGCGVAAFNNSLEVCELRKLFLLPEARGVGIGKKLTLRSLNFARQAGFKRCYLDTLANMKVAIKMYESIGFTVMAEPLAGAVHSGCDTWMIKDL